MEEVMELSPVVYPLALMTRPESSSASEDESSITNPSERNDGNGQLDNSKPVTDGGIFQKISCSFLTVLYLGTNRYIYMMLHSHHEAFFEQYKEDLKTWLVFPPILLMSIYALIQRITGPAVALLLVSFVSVIISVVHIFALLCYIRMIPQFRTPQQIDDAYAWDVSSLALPVAWLAWGLLLFIIAIPIWTHVEGDPAMLTIGSRVSIVIVTVCGIGRTRDTCMNVMRSHDGDDDSSLLYSLSFEWTRIYVDEPLRVLLMIVMDTCYRLRAGSGSNDLTI